MTKATVLSIAAILMLSACNTIDGFGEDMSHAGDAVSETSDSVANKIEGDGADAAEGAEEAAEAAVE